MAQLLVQRVQGTLQGVAPVGQHQGMEVPEQQTARLMVSTAERPLFASAGSISQASCWS
jgi:hypothetical protein